MFSTSKVYREISGQILTIYVSRNEAVCCEVQTHFASSSACKIDKKVVGAFAQLTCRANKHSSLQHFVKMLWPDFMILHVPKSLLGCSATL